MLEQRSLALLLPVFLGCFNYGWSARKPVSPKPGVAVLVNANNSHISIDSIDGEHKGVRSQGINELAPGRHTLRARLFYRQGNTEWSSNNFQDYSFEASGGSVLNVVCVETRSSSTAGTWRMWIEDTATGKDINARPPSLPVDSTEHQLQLERNFAEIRGKAEAGDLESQFNLGLLLERGEGTPPSHAEAAGWYRKAAERGHATAQFMLGLCYDQGQGVAQVPAEAFIWLSLAAESGDSSAPYFRDEIEKTLSPEDLKKANERVKKLKEEIGAKTGTP